MILAKRFDCECLSQRKKERGSSCGFELFPFNCPWIYSNIQILKCLFWIVLVRTEIIKSHVEASKINLKKTMSKKTNKKYTQRDKKYLMWFDQSTYVHKRRWAIHYINMRVRRIERNNLTQFTWNTKRLTHVIMYHLYPTNSPLDRTLKALTLHCESYQVWRNEILLEP